MNVFLISVSFSSLPAFDLGSHSFMPASPLALQDEVGLNFSNGGGEAVIRSSRILTSKVRLDEGKTSAFQHTKRRRLEIRRVRFQAPRLGLVRRAGWNYSEG
jgi:hypothetical protein